MTKTQDPPSPIPNPRHTSGGADPRRPYVVRDEAGGGKVIVPFFSDDEMVSILRALASRDPEAAKLEEMREALQVSANTFWEYVIIHEAKKTPDGQAKADRNREMAEMCDAALGAANTPEQQGDGG